ncbi:TPT1 [Mytilus edulis]|uniref:2'-phosphotransferase n=1 Tax=Mytilus edulis TaxID=6550 RepID=A0A8S3UQ85_MYTED|nr:TPT1 [Mytilus edulis]
MEYRKLVDYGLNSKVAIELCVLFESGKVSPQELDNRALDALKECNVNEAVTLIKKFSEALERNEVKNKIGYLCGMIKKKRQKQGSQGPAMPKNQGEKSDLQLSKALAFVLRHGAEKLGYIMMPGGFLYVEDILQKQHNLSNYGPEDVKRIVETSDKQRFHIEWERETGKMKIRANQGHSIEPNTMNPSQFQGGPQGMYANQGYNQQLNQFQGYNQQQNQFQGYNQPPNQFQGYNRPPNQYQGRPQGMYDNQGYNQQPNQHQRYNQPRNQFPGNNQPRHPQNYGPGMMPTPFSPAQNMNPPQQYFMGAGGAPPGGAPPGQGPGPYAPPSMGQYNPNLLQGNLNIIDQGSQHMNQQTPDREKQPKKKKAKKNKQRTEENETQDPTKSEDGFLKLKSLLSEEPGDHYRVETGDKGEGMDDDSNRGGGRGRRRRGGRNRRGRGGKNNHKDDKQDSEDSESSESSESEDEMDKYLGSRDDLLGQRSNRGSRGNLNKVFGSVDSISSQGSRQNRRGRGGYNRGRGGQTSHMNEGESNPNEEIGQSNRGHQGVRGRGQGRGQPRGRGGRGQNENRNDRRENDGEDANGNQRGRGKGRDRGRGRGGRQQNERTNELEDGEIPDVDDNDVFKFLIKIFGGGCTFEDFLRRCDLFPMHSNIPLWFKKHSRRFHVFWEGKDIIYVQPFFSRC